MDRVAMLHSLFMSINMLLDLVVYLTGHRYLILMQGTPARHWQRSSRSLRSGGWLWMTNTCTMSEP